MRQNMLSSVRYPHLVRIREEHRGKRIVFCSGGFDLTHPGHVLFFEDCKRHGDVLVVGVGGDVARSREKGPGRPVMNQHLRLKMVLSLKPVDYAFVIADEPPGGHHLDALKPVFEALKPDAYVINDDAFNIPYREAMTAELGVKLVVLPRWCPPEFERVSTTKLIERVRKLGSAD